VLNLFGNNSFLSIFDQVTTVNEGSTIYDNKPSDISQSKKGPVPFLAIDNGV
jgi:hypothetical protein